MNRAVITGLGAVTPSGNTATALWDAVRTGQSAITALSAPGTIGGTVRDFHDTLTPPLTHRLSIEQRWALAAGGEALAQAGVTAGDHHRIGVIVGTGSGPRRSILDAVRAYDVRGARAVPPVLPIYATPDAAASVIAQQYGLHGETSAVSATCASSTIALGHALRHIRHGYADAMLVIGMENLLDDVMLAAQRNLGALADGEDAAAASRPFDRQHTGFVMSAGAAALLVESAAHAAARGAQPLAELAGFGASNDAAHPTAPHPDGRGGSAAITAALEDAGLRPEDVDHINAHGTGTPVGDAAELRALAGALGHHAHGIPISATKSSTGHLLGASGAVEAVIAVKTLQSGILPPTINLAEPIEEGWDFVTTARTHETRVIVSPAFGFGGHNAAAVFRRR